MFIGHECNPKQPGISNLSVASALVLKCIPTVRAVQTIRRMRGGAQSQLMLCDDGNLWVVKFKNNPQHLRVLTNELMATRIAAYLGLSVPPASHVEVDAWLIETNPDLYVDLGQQVRQPCQSGLHFGSLFAGGLMPRQVLDILPGKYFPQLRNVEQFAGMLAFDKWTGNCDGRQAVYRRTSQERLYTAIFIDQGYCFNGGEWNFPDAPLKGAFARDIAYEGVIGWDSFEPWLSRIEQFDSDILWDVAKTVPKEWSPDGQDRPEVLVEMLLKRRSRVREQIIAFRDSDRSPFPLWNPAGKRIFCMRAVAPPSTKRVFAAGAD